MTDLELDKMLQRVLLDALKSDERQESITTPPFTPSSQHLRKMRSMCKDPIKWLHKLERPVWRRVLHHVAMILLVISIGFGSVVITVPSVRAAVIRWVTEWYETHIVYRYSGEPTPDGLSEYEITVLPDGFAETARDTLPNITDVTYEDKAGNIISFCYTAMSQGGGSVFYMDDSIVIDVSVSGMYGQFFESKTPDKFNTITWINHDHNIQFSISGIFDQATLLRMAESVSIKNKF